MSHSRGTSAAFVLVRVWGWRKRGGGGDGDGLWQGGGDVDERGTSALPIVLPFDVVALFIARAPAKARVEGDNQGGPSVSHCGGGGSGWSPLESSDHTRLWGRVLDAIG